MMWGLLLLLCHSATQYSSRSLLISTNIFSLFLPLSQMLTKTIMFGARTVAMEARRSFGVCIPAAQKVSDPIQQLFLDKVRDYKAKSK